MNSSEVHTPIPQLSSLNQTIESELKPTPSSSQSIVQIDKKRLEHLLNLEKEYTNIIAYGVKLALQSSSKVSKGK